MMLMKKGVKMMTRRQTLNEVYEDIDITRRIFYSMQTSPSGTNVPWIRAFNSEDLDRIYFLVHSGKKYISSFVKYYADASGGKLDATQNAYLSLNVRNFYLKKWQELYNTLSYTYDPISNYDMVETETINTQGGESQTGQNTETPLGSETDTLTYSGSEKDILKKLGQEKNETEYSGSEKDTLKKLGQETNETEYSGSESTIETPTGREKTITEYGGSENTTQGGTKTTTTSMTPIGSEITNENKSETYNSLKDTNTEYGFNSSYDTPPSPQNESVRTGSINTSNFLQRSFIGRNDLTTTDETFNDYTTTKSFDRREDVSTLEFDGRETETEKSYTDRVDTSTTSFTDRQDESEKTFTNRKDTTQTSFNDRQDENEKTFTNRKDTREIAFSEDRQTIIDTSNAVTRSSIVSRTLTRRGNIGVTTTQQMIEAQRELLLWDYFYKIVFPDLDKLLTLSIY